MKYFFLVLTLLVSPACQKEDKSKQLIIFHAGSLSMPLKKIAREFEKENRGVTVLLEASGSRVCARKISELHRRADIMASADYTVINTLLVPDHAAFTIPFAGNEMVIAYGKKSRKRDHINASNWFQILLDSDVAYGRSDPDSDPCGYRTVMVMKLSELHYKIPGLAKSLLQKDKKSIRPKETDLLALLEAGQIDYLFIYKSVAVQHHLSFIPLPPRINLKSPAHKDLYGTVYAEVSGKKPATTIKKYGAPMVYGVTIPKNAPNRPLAEKFLVFLLTREKGMKILEEMGQTSLVPSPTKTFEELPPALKPFARPKK